MMKLVSNIMKSRKVRRSMNEIKAEKQKAVPVQCYTRTVGYFAPISQMNPGKREEVKNRKLFNVKTLSTVLSKRDEVENYDRALALK